MFFVYLYRELRRRHRQALLTALGLALGVCLVVTVAASAGGVRDAQDQVLHSLYGVGTDITVSKNAQRDSGGPLQMGMQPGQDQKAGQSFSRDRAISTPGLALLSDLAVTKVASLQGVTRVAGSLDLTTMHVSGKFAQIQGMAQSGGLGQPGQSGTTPNPSASMAPIKITSYSVSGVDVTEQASGPLSSVTISDGRTFTTDETKAKLAIVDSGYAKQNSLGVGDSVSLGGDTYTIIGVAKTASSQANLYIPLARAQKLADAEGKVNHIYVKAGSATQIAQVKKSIKTTIPGATVTTAQDLADQVSGSLSSASSLSDRLGTWLAVAALVTAFGVAILLTLSAVSRRVREFGTLKALGWRSRRIVAQVMGESLVQGLIGGILGVGLALIATQLISRFSPTLKATVGATDFRLPGALAGGPPGAAGPADAARALTQTVTVYLDAPLDIQLLGLAIALAVAGGLLAGALGGWRAARLSPADAMRRVD